MRKNKESNISYRDRLRFVSNSKIDSTHNGLINGIGVEVGLLSSGYIRIINNTLKNIRVTSNYIYCDDQYILLANNTINDIDIWLNTQSDIISTIINSDYLNLPAESLLYSNNEYTIGGLVYNNTDRIHIPIKYDHELFSVELNDGEGSEHELDSDSIESYNGDILKFYFHLNMIYTSRSLTYNDKITMSVRGSDIVLNGCPILSKSIHDHDADLPIVEDMVKYAETIYSNKFS